MRRTTVSGQKWLDSGQGAIPNFDYCGWMLDVKCYVWMKWYPKTDKESWVWSVGGSKPEKARTRDLAMKAALKALKKEKL